LTGAISLQPGDVLLVVDAQNDFCPGGRLAVPDGDAIIALVNRLAQKFDNVVMTQDWHPAGHASFASSHPGKKPFDVIELSYGLQVLWPDHCVEESEGARFHDGLAIPHAALILRKGFHPAIDSYSAFYENDRTTSTGLAGYLRARGLSRLFVVGLAFDFCVRYSAEDGCAEGFPTFVIEDACRGIDLDGSMGKARQALAAKGAKIISSSALR
jgi:nicotinamidase/pyrazinamidase